MFRRRVPKSVLGKTRELLWPRAGWRRAGLYVWHRLHRLPGTTSAIAAGFAFGAAVSFIPLNGLHFLIAALCAWMTRTSILASAIGTVVGNPWTFPPIWFGTWWLGRLLLGDAAQGDERLNFRALFEALWYGLRHFDVAYLAEHVWPVWWPMFVGSLPVAVVAWFGFYVVLRRAIASYHRIRGLRRLERLAQRTRALGQKEDASHQEE